jgi:protein-disulfide isomerase
VRVLIYEDLQCPDCADFRVMMDQKILPKYGEQVEFVHRDFPLAKHPCARSAAIAARFFFSRDAKLGLEYRRHALATIRETTVENFKDRVAAFARSHGVVHTPTVYVNGSPFIETFTFEEISKGIDQALAQAK